MPTALRHLVADIVDVVLLRVEGNDRSHGVTVHIQAGDGLDRLADLDLGTDNVLGLLDVALLTNVHHRCPAAGNQCSRTGTGNRGRGINSTRPVALLKVLEATKSLAMVHDDGRSFGGESVLVGVARDGGDSWNTEIESRELVAGLLGKGNHETSQAAVDVETNVVLLGELAHSDNIIHDTVGVVDGGSCQEDSVLVDSLLDGVHVGLHGDGVDGNMDQLHAKVVSSLVESSVDGNRSNTIEGNMRTKQ